MSASVNLPVHHKVQKFSSGTGSSGWSQKNGSKTVVVGGYVGFRFNFRFGKPSFIIRCSLPLATQK